MRFLVLISKRNKKKIRDKEIRTEIRTKREERMNHKTCFVSIDRTIIRVRVVEINEAPAS